LYFVCLDSNSLSSFSSCYSDDAGGVAGSALTEIDGAQDPSRDKGELKQANTDKSDQEALLLQSSRTVDKPQVAARSKSTSEDSERQAQRSGTPLRQHRKPPPEGLIGAERMKEELESHLTKEDSKMPAVNQETNNGLNDESVKTDESVAASAGQKDTIEDDTPRYHNGAKKSKTVVQYEQKKLEEVRALNQMQRSLMGENDRNWSHGFVPLYPDDAKAKNTDTSKSTDTIAGPSEAASVNTTTRKNSENKDNGDVSAADAANAEDVSREVQNESGCSSGNVFDTSSQEAPPASQSSLSDNDPGYLASDESLSSIGGSSDGGSIVSVRMSLHSPLPPLPLLGNPSDMSVSLYNADEDDTSIGDVTMQGYGDSGVVDATSLFHFHLMTRGSADSSAEIERSVIRWLLVRPNGDIGNLTAGFEDVVRFRDEIEVSNIPVILGDDANDFIDVGRMSLLGFGEEDELRHLTRPLSFEEASLFSAYMNDRRPANTIVARGESGRNSICLADLQELRLDGRVHCQKDSVINFYLQEHLQRLNAHYCARCLEKPVGFFSSYFYGTLMQSGQYVGGEYCYRAVRTWGTSVAARANVESIFNMKFVIFPIHQRRLHHYTCVVALMEQKVVRYYNSCEHETHEDILRNIVRYIRDEARALGEPVNLNDWRLVGCTSNIPQQLNGHDCGIFVCMDCYFISMGLEPLFEQKHIAQIKKRILLSIHERGVLNRVINV